MRIAVKTGRLTRPVWAGVYSCRRFGYYVDYAPWPPTPYLSSNVQFMYLTPDSIQAAFGYGLRAYLFLPKPIELHHFSLPWKLHDR